MAPGTRWSAAPLPRLGARRGQCKSLAAFAQGASSRTVRFPVHWRNHRLKKPHKLTVVALVGGHFGAQDMFIEHLPNAATRTFFDPDPLAQSRIRSVNLHAIGSSSLFPVQNSELRTFPFQYDPGHGPSHIHALQLMCLTASTCADCQ